MPGNRPTNMLLAEVLTPPRSAASSRSTSTTCSRRGRSGASTRSTSGASSSARCSPKRIVPELESARASPSSKHDSSTNALIRKYRGAEALGAELAMLRSLPPAMITARDPFRGGNKPCSTTPGVAGQVLGERRRVGERAVIIRDHAAVGAAGHVAEHDIAQSGHRRASGRTPAVRAALGRAAPRQVSTSLRSRRSGQPRLRRASRAGAAPPPFTSHPSGAIWSAPSIVMSNRSMVSNASTRNPSASAAASVRGDVATQRSESLRRAKCGEQIGNSGAGAEPDRHPVLDELGRSLGRESLLLFHVCHVLAPRRREPTGPIVSPA